MMFSLTPIVDHERSPFVESSKSPGDGAGSAGRVEDAHLVIGEMDAAELGKAVAAPPDGARRVRASTGPLPSAVATMRSPPNQTLSVASL